MLFYKNSTKSIMQKITLLFLIFSQIYFTIHFILLDMKLFHSSIENYCCILIKFTKTCNISLFEITLLSFTVAYIALKKTTIICIEFRKKFKTRHKTLKFPSIRSQYDDKRYKTVSSVTENDIKTKFDSD